MKAIDADKILYYVSINPDTLEGTGRLFAPKELIDVMPTIEPKREAGKNKMHDARTIIPVACLAGLFVGSITTAIFGTLNWWLDKDKEDDDS